VARYITLGVFMTVWGAVTIIVALQEGGKVPPEYWTIPGIGIGGILGAFAAFERIAERRNNGNSPTPTPTPSNEED
jgi:hypothetical protein